VLALFAVAACGTDETTTDDTTMMTDTTVMAPAPAPGTGMGMGADTGMSGTMGAGAMDATGDLDATIAAAEGGLTSLAPGAAVSNIEMWQGRLRAANNPALSTIADDLEELKTELGRSPINGTAVGSILSRVGERTTAAASGADPAVSQRITRLGTLLSQAGTQLGGSR
jgi:hypothetical protein